MEFPIKAYYSAYPNFDVIRKLAKDAENFSRKEMGVPLVGEGWIAETELFRKLEDEFSFTTVIQHGQPMEQARVQLIEEAFHRLMFADTEAVH